MSSLNGFAEIAVNNGSLHRLSSGQTCALSHPPECGTMEVALANLKSHMETVVKHFKGKVISWDVVNEALSDAPGEYLRDTPARRAIGDDYIARAFEYAHAADPDVMLYYNDFRFALSLPSSVDFTLCPFAQVATPSVCGAMRPVATV